MVLQHSFIRLLLELEINPDFSIETALYQTLKWLMEGPANKSYCILVHTVFAIK